MSRCGVDLVRHCVVRRTRLPVQHVSQAAELLEMYKRAQELAELGMAALAAKVSPIAAREARPDTAINDVD